MKKDIKNAADKMEEIMTILSNDIFVERESEIRGIALALIARTNVLLLGEPGVAKSLLVTAWQKHVKDTKYFEWLLNPFTTPDEIAGHISLKSLEQDSFKRTVSNTVNDAHFAFLDEFWKSNGGVINHLLPLMNERVYYNDGKRQKAPLLTLIGASNELPEPEDHLDAALDRFVLKFQVKTIKERSNWIVMAKRFLDWSSRDLPPKEMISLEELNILQDAIKDVEISDGILTLLLDIKNALEKDGNGVFVSPRVFNNSLRIIQASAVLRGSMVAEEEDLGIIKHTFWKDPAHENIIWREVLEKTFPDRAKAEEIKAEIDEIYLEYEKLAKETNTEVLPKILTLITSLKRCKNTLISIKKDIVEKRKPSKFITQYLEDLNFKMRTIQQERLIED